MDKKFVIIFFGLPGSGKSFLAEKLAKELKTDYLSSDKIRQDIFLKKSYSKKEKEEVYLAMFQEMINSLESESSVILDASFSKSGHRNKFGSKCMEMGVKCFFIEMHASVEISKQRTQKERKYSDADYGVYQIMKTQFESMKEPHLLLDSGKLNEKEMMRIAINYISQND